jgi:hypothetical protein
LFLALLVLHVAAFWRTFRYYGTWPQDVWRLYPEYAPDNGTVFPASVVSLLVALSAALMQAKAGNAASGGRGGGSSSSSSSSGGGSSGGLGNRSGSGSGTGIGGSGYFSGVLGAAHTCAGLSLLLVCVWHGKGAWWFSLVGLSLHAANTVVRTHRTARLVKVTSLKVVVAVDDKDGEVIKGEQRKQGSGGSGGGSLLRLSYQVERYRGGRGRLPPWLTKLLGPKFGTCAGRWGLVWFM